MSGGSYNYAFQYVENFIAELDAQTPERRAFKDHLELVRQAMHDIEWVDSCDYGRGQENDAILRCVSQSDVLNASVENAKKALDELKRLLAQAKRKR